MKKLILFFAVVSLALTSCDPPQNAWIWLVKNNTEQTIKFKYPASQNYQVSTLSPGESVFVSDILYPKSRRYNLQFNDYFENITNEYGDDVYWQILSEDDVVLKTWDYSDKDKPGQRFFDESSWAYNQGNNGAQFIAENYSWLFNISSEDILPTDQ